MRIRNIANLTFTLVFITACMGDTGTPTHTTLPTTTGTLQVMMIEEEPHFSITADDGEVLRLVGDAEIMRMLSQVPAGTKIDITGVRQSQSFELEDFFVLGDTGGILQNGDPNTAHYAPALGTRKIAVILVNFLDDTSEPGTVEEAQQAMDTVNAYFAESSYGQLITTSDVYGWWTLPYNTSRCTEFPIVSNEILQEAEDRGVDLSAYKHLIYVFNHQHGGYCGSGGGTVSPNSPRGLVWRTWTHVVGGEAAHFDGVAGINTTLHELGHNLGFWHARWLLCGQQTLGDSCTAWHYGDRWDTMGGGKDIHPHYNAFHKERVGWVSSDPTAPAVLQNIYKSGVYTITPYEQGAGTKVLKIRRGPNATGGIDHFYIEYRQPLGFDVGFLNYGYGNVFDGIMIHMGNDTMADSSDLLDLEPSDNNTTNSGVGNFNIALEPGNRFHDNVSQVTVEVLSAGTSGATVDVTVGADLWEPSISFTSPASGAVLEKGSQVTFSVEATDMVAMGQVDFFIDGVLEHTVLASNAQENQYSFTYSVPKGKTRTFRVIARAIDAAGNFAETTSSFTTGDTNGGKGGKKNR